MDPGCAQSVGKVSAYTSNSSSHPCKFTRLNHIVAWSAVPLQMCSDKSPLFLVDLVSVYS